MEQLKPKSRASSIGEKIAEYVFLLCAVISVVSLLIIAFFIIGQGMPGMLKIGIGKFLTGQVWQPRAEIFGILPMILGSIYATIGAAVIGVPIGILTAVFISEIAPKGLAKKVRAAVDLLAAIPSVVYGFFGLIVFVPMIDKVTNGAGGDSLLAAILILSVMILPTITSITETSLRAVPDVYREGSLALGATHIQTIFHVTIPAAKSGIFSAVVLGIGRAVGEAMAVILVSGNSPQIAGSLFDRIRTMTANIALEMGYASGLHTQALFATGVVLFLFIMLLNVLLNFIKNRSGVGDEK